MAEPRRPGERAPSAAEEAERQVRDVETEVTEEGVDQRHRSGVGDPLTASRTAQREASNVETTEGLDTTGDGEEDGRDPHGDREPEEGAAPSADRDRR